MHFDDDQIKTMVTMYHNYYLTRQIADALGRSIQSVKQKLRKLGLPRRNQRVLELIKWHGREILEYGYAPEDVYRFLNKEKTEKADRAEIGFRQFKEDLKTLPRDMCIIKAAEAGVPGVQMSFLLGISRQRISEIVRNDRKQRRGPRRAAKTFKG